MATVIGIFPESNVSALESALAAHHIDASKVKVLTKSAPSQAMDDSIIDFISVAQAQSSNDFSDDMTHGTGMMSDSGGTGVPGIGGSGPSLSSLGGGSRTVTNYFAGIAVPIDQVDNYNDAIEAGRSVVVCSDAADTAVDAFKAAGLRNVRAF